MEKYKTLEEKIYSFEEENTVIGIGDASPFYELEEILKNTDTPFVEKDIKKRIYPEYSRKTANSIIALALSYNKKFIGELDKKIRGNMSIGAIGKDYHILVKEKLLNIKNSLNLDGDIFVDTGYLVDREVAKRCGIGYIGKSGNLINEKLGSIIYIGYMLIDEKLKPTKNFISNLDLCKDCDRCIKYCPTKSIKLKNFNYKTCISYLTQNKNITQEEQALIGKQIYGCDICQIVCPYNQNKYIEYSNNIEDFFPDLENLLFMTNKQFNETYKKTAAGWRGKKILQRNAILSISNGAYSLEKVDLLNRFIKNEKREDIKEIAIKSLKKLEDKKDGVF